LVEEIKFKRYYFLDALRGIAALLVVIYHFTQPTSFPIAKLSYFNVDLFFILSGFVIALNYTKKIDGGMKFSRFMSIRLARLYPMFLLGITIGYCALAIKFTHGRMNYSQTELLSALVCNLFYLPYINNKEVELFTTMVPGVLFPSNIAAWSLFFEIVINIFFYYNLKVLKLSTSFVAGAALVMFAIFIIYNQGDAGWNSENWFLAFPRVMFGFYAGCLIHEFTQNERYFSFRRQAASWSKPLALAVPILLVVSSFWPFAEERFFFFAMISVFPALIFLSTCLETEGFGQSVCKVLGYISYPIYCLHVPILHMADALRVKYALSISDFQLLAYSFFAALLIAVIAQRLVDVPLQRKFGKLLSRDRPNPALS
jgi:peptidoglycan/LPS O-acetylase OafA/YrhL